MFFSVETLKTVFDWGTIVLLFLTFAFGFGALVTGDKINKEQAKKIRSFDKSLTNAQIDLGKQQVLVDEAHGNVATLEKAAADAKSGQQQVEIALEKQKEKTAEAETQMLALAKRQSPRFIENHSLSKVLHGKPTGPVIIWYQPDDPEAYWFAFQIMGELMKAKWKVTQPAPIPNNVSMVSFMGPEFQKDIDLVTAFDQNLPLAVRLSGGSGELALLSKSSPDPKTPDSLVNILSEALRPLARANYGWKLASELPEDTFIVLVGPKQ